jgi:hypothetical protein
MNGVQIIKTVNLTLTADQWELYDIPGRDGAAFQLNRALEEIINDPEIPQKHKLLRCHKILGGFGDYGANDTEGYHVVDCIFERLQRDA